MRKTGESGCRLGRVGLSQKISASVSLRIRRAMRPQPQISRAGLTGGSATKQKTLPDNYRPDTMKEKLQSSRLWAFLCLFVAMTLGVQTASAVPVDVDPADALAQVAATAADLLP